MALLLYLFATAASLADCPDGPSSFASITAEISEAYDAYDAGDIPTFTARGAEIDRQMRCIDEILLASTVRQIHEFEAFYAHASGDHDRSSGAIRAWLKDTDHGDLVGRLSNTPLMDLLNEVVSRPNSIQIPVRVASGYNGFLNGRQATTRDVNASALLQIENPDGSVFLTRYIHAGDALPRPLVEPNSLDSGFEKVHIAGGIKASAVAPDCNGIRGTIDSHAITAISAFSNMDESTFKDAFGQATRLVRCSTTVVRHSEAAAYHRISGLDAFMRGDQTRALRAFRAAILRQPGKDLPTSMAPPGSRLQSLYALARERPVPSLVPIGVPAKHTTYVDGRLDAFYPAHAPFILQLLNKKEEVLSTHILDSGSVLQAPFLNPVVLQPMDAGNPPKSDFRGGLTVELRGGLTGGAIHQYYREGVFIDEDNEASWTGYGFGLMNSDVLPFHGSLALGIASRTVDVGMAIGLLSNITLDGKFYSFGDYELSDSEAAVHIIKTQKESSKRSAVPHIEIYFRRYFAVAPKFRFLLSGSVGLLLHGALRSFENTCTPPVSNSNAAACPIGTPLTAYLTLSAGAGLSYDLFPWFSLLLEMQAGLVALNIESTETEERIQFAEDHAYGQTAICPSEQSCTGAAELRSGNIYSPEARDEDYFPDGATLFGFKGTVFLGVQFRFDSNK